ncbi:DUF935 domain-containing protein [Escherichia coli]|nr:DUF935 domain-containing protein [Escherichia coli]
MSDAVLYGYQPCEIMWGRSVRSWAVTDIVGKPPEWFQFDTDNCLRFRRVMRVWRVSCCHRQNSWCRHRMPRMTILTVSRTLSMCFWPVAFKKGGMKFWLRFAEKFGSPWVIA